MSIRYGILLVPEPSFTALAYRARQLICGQFGSWAAEMFMVHLTVADFFQCPDSAVAAVDNGLAGIAEQSRREAPQFPLSHLGLATFPDEGGTIFLDFNDPQKPLALHTLHTGVIDLLQRTPGVIPDLRFALGEYWPHLTLMQYGNLPPAVFADALEFAGAVAEGLGLPAATRAWRLLLARFQSEAAGDDWRGGRWAADLRWDVMSSYGL